LNRPDLLTQLIFNGSVVVKVSSDYDDSVMVNVSNIGDSEHDSKSFQLEPDEIDLFIATLNLYKNRILNGERGTNE